MAQADLLYPSALGLGESALWLADRQRLAFVDIDAGDLYLLDPAHPLLAERQHLGAWLSAVVPAQGGGILAASAKGLGLVSGAGHFEPLVANDAHFDLHRYNDAKTDRQGRLIIGTMPKLAPRTPTGRLYAFEGTARRSLVEGLTTPNALCFSPDGRWMYGCDSAEGVIWRWPYSPETGALGEKQLFAPREIAPGGPDGATIDADGCLWSARYNGGSVARITPKGKLDRLIELPVQQITSIAFGGAGLDQCFVTTARQNLGPQALAAQPLSGSIFTFSPGVSGLAETEFSVRPPAGGGDGADLAVPYDP